jgi:radical SAM superfamily enzyme YgiQ (UPF0313 family)
MRALLIYPHFPRTFWLFERMLAMAGRKAVLPPLGLLTVAAILPQEWEFRLADRNVEPVSDADWDRAEIVLVSGMIVQRPDYLAVIREAGQRGKKVAVGGPYATAFSQEVAAAGADYLVLDEGEHTIPLLLEALEKGEPSGTFRSAEKPDVTQTPIPRFDLLNLDAYSEMAVQFSRGCPFRCEFCDIIVLYGRRPRTKTPQQMLAELERLHELGWRRSVFVVDDNFIGNKHDVKGFLRELQPWMEERGQPFRFGTEASLDLAKDQELMDLMTACNFGAVFLGIETPDEASLEATHKHQNLRGSLAESVHKIAASGLRVMAGFIIGFDGEKAGAGQRIVDFVEEAAIPTAFFSMLQALPDTALWHRLNQEGRLRGASGVNQTTLMNFIPTRPMEEVAREYVDGFWDLYDPQRFLDRTYRHYRTLGDAPCHRKPSKKVLRAGRQLNWREVRAFASILARQGIVRKTRVTFWRYLWQMYRHNPGRVISYLTVCAQIEHFLEYRELVRKQIGDQSAAFTVEDSSPAAPVLAETRSAGVAGAVSAPLASES